MFSRFLDARAIRTSWRSTAGSAASWRSPAATGSTSPWRRQRSSRATSSRSGSSRWRASRTRWSRCRRGSRMVPHLFFYARTLGALLRGKPLGRRPRLGGALYPGERADRLPYPAAMRPLVFSSFQNQPKDVPAAVQPDRALLPGAGLGMDRVRADGGREPARPARLPRPADADDPPRGRPRRVPARRQAGRRGPRGAGLVDSGAAGRGLPSGGSCPRRGRSA